MWASAPLVYIISANGLVLFEFIQSGSKAAGHLISDLSRFMSSVLQSPLSWVRLAWICDEGGEKSSNQIRALKTLCPREQLRSEASAMDVNFAYPVV